MKSSFAAILEGAANENYREVSANRERCRQGAGVGDSATAAAVGIGRAAVDGLRVRGGAGAVIKEKPRRSGAVV